ncbi:MAG TPA: hypothetical protein VMV19_01420 [Xanthobacteraceae bacterium]|nr:hypothetical protein [Xanthobacteraceae bacterium]
MRPHTPGERKSTPAISKSKHSVKGDASVTLTDGKVTRVVVDVYWCGLPGRPGYSCLIDASRGDSDAKWSEAGDTTRIHNAAPANPTYPDRMKVTLGQDISIDLAEAQSLGRCGAGAELPRTIVIPAKRAACQVQLGEP